jgi:hypothetical protein
MATGVPGLDSVLPWALVVSAGGSETSVAGAVITGQEVAAPAAIVTTAAACVVFTVVAFWKWQRTEL